ncbi:hypothetical protein MBT84_00610 [Streptomyces sp. MBT84]|nr:hypothetical protein [Streptomyces sp. MBT84]
MTPQLTALTELQAGAQWDDWASLVSRGSVVDLYLNFAAALVTLRTLLRRATSCFRWDGRPTTRRLN